MITKKINWSTPLAIWRITIPRTGLKTQPMFYYPEMSRIIMRNMELWKIIIKFRDQQTGRKLTITKKELFYQDAHKVLEKAIFLIEKYTIPVTSTIQIAQVSCASSDYSTALTIADAYAKVGSNGLKMIVEGDNLNDELLVLPGMQLSPVCIYPMFITNNSGIDVFKNSLFILYGDKLESVDELKEIITFAKSHKNPLIIILKDYNWKAVHDLIQMKLKEKLDLVAVEFSKDDDKDSITMEDLSILTGTKITRKSLQNTQLEETVGKTTTAYFTEDELLMIGLKLDEHLNLEKYSASLKEEYKPEELDMYQERVQKLSNTNVALIKIGGIDEVDIRKRMGVAVDTLGRAEQAVQQGIIVGDGRCLLDIIEQVSKSVNRSSHPNGGTIVVEAMKYFHHTHSEKNRYYNLSGEKSLQVPKFYGYDVKTKQFVNLLSEGILDPKSYFAQSLIFAKQKCQAYGKEARRSIEF